MKNVLKGALVAASVAAFSMPNTAAAQSASIGARATVQVALTISAVDSLILGAAFPSTTRTILPTDASSGSFTLSGAANAEVSLTFTLPANLTFGANNLPITFGNQSGSWSTAGTRAGSTLFNPAAPLLTRLNNVTGALGVYVGASVSPVAQPAGSYTGQITLATAYTGN